MARDLHRPRSSMLGPGSQMTWGWRQAAALGLSGLLAVSLLAAQAHQVVALHAVCSRHGELIHVEGGDPATTAPPAAGALTDGATAGLEGAHGCAALLLLSTAFVGSPPALAVLSPATDPHRTSARGPLAARPPVPLLLQAPKHSPPGA